MNGPQNMRYIVEEYFSMYLFNSYDACLRITKMKLKNILSKIAHALERP